MKAAAVVVTVLYIIVLLLATLHQCCWYQTTSNNNKNNVPLASLGHLKSIGPEHSNYCEIVVNDTQPRPLSGKVGSQNHQEFFLYRNFFMGKTDGIYLDLGANHPEALSNTFFFEKCLGWRGVCLEPNPQYFDAWKESRSCKHMPKCVYKEETTIEFSLGTTRN
jgi:hypothetical protein